MKENIKIGDLYIGLICPYIVKIVSVKDLKAQIISVPSNAKQGPEYIGYIFHMQLDSWKPFI